MKPAEILNEPLLLQDTTTEEELQSASPLQSSSNNLDNELKSQSSTSSNSIDANSAAGEFFRVMSTGDVEAVLMNKSLSQNKKMTDLEIFKVKFLAVSVQVFGVPYSGKQSFWCKLLPLVIVLGLLCGLFSFLFFGGFHSIYKILYLRRDVDDEGGLSIGEAGFMRGELYWIGINVLGAFLTNLVFCLPRAPTFLQVSNLYSHFVFMEGSLRHAPYILLACFIALSFGACVGPEMGLGLLGCSLGELFRNQFNQRSQKLLLLAGFAASLGGLLPSPIMAIFLTHELCVISNAGNTSLYRYENDDDTSHIFSLQPGRQLHDHMEQCTVIGIAAISSFTAFRTFIKFDDDSDDEDDYLNNDNLETYHLLSAVVLGPLCAVFGLLFIMFQGIFRKLRNAVNDKLFSGQSKIAVFLKPVFVATLGGLAYGFITYCFPLCAGAGSEALRDVTILSLNRTIDDGLLNGWDEENDEVIYPSTLLLSCIFKIISNGLCSGLAYLGGPFLPIVTAGGYLGAALDIWAPDVFPASMSIPCCVCGVIGSIVPLPFTIISIVIFLDSDPLKIAAALTTTIVSFSCLMGNGFFPSIALKDVQKILEKYPDEIRVGSDTF